MKISPIIFLTILFLSHESTHNIVLSPSGSTVDDTPLVQDPINGVSEIPNSILIREPNTYILQGNYIGQVFIKLDDETKNSTIVLNGVNITNPNGPGIVISRAREIDNYKYSDKDYITYEKALKVDWGNIGVRIVIADDSENIINAGYNDDYDGAIYSKISIVIDGGVKGNGKLTIIAGYEGLNSKRHIQINGGIINIVAYDDGINGSEEYGSLIEINGGKITVNGGQSLQRGDGIDCNGMLLINGGEVIAAGYERMDSGLDASAGLIITGGIAIGTGSSMDKAGNGCKQPSMNLKFTSDIDPKSVFTIEDSKGNVIVRFSPSDCGFVEGSILHGYPAMTISHPKFETFKVYRLFVDGKLMGYSSNVAKSSFGFGGWGSNVDNGDNKDKKGENYYKVNLNNGLEKGDSNKQNNQQSNVKSDEVEYRSVFLFSKIVESFQGIAVVK